jgi:hypothetical protein
VKCATLALWRCADQVFPLPGDSDACNASCHCLVVVSLCAFVPAFAMPVRLSSPDGVYSNVIRTQELRLQPPRPSRPPPRIVHPPQPSLDHLLRTYEADTGTYNDKPKILPKETVDAPLAVETSRTLEDRPIEKRPGCDPNQNPVYSQDKTLAPCDHYDLKLRR